MTTLKPKKWLSITILCPDSIAEAVADHLGVMSGSGVEIRPQDPLQGQKITGFFLLDDNESDEVLALATEKVLARVTDELEELFDIYDLPLPDLETKTIDDEDWATSWQQFFTTTEIVPGLIIKPSWEEYSPARGQLVITMDPGMAFGTGQHASTKLALSFISSCFKTTSAKTPHRALDIGTGTGILAMATALYGAEDILAIDNDPEAVTVARHNVHQNQLDRQVDVSNRSLDELQGSYDLICANIIHDVLVDMASSISRLAAPGSHIVLAGILSGDQENNIKRIYQEHGLKFVREEYEEEWVALLFERQG